MLQATDFSSKLIAELVHTELNSLNSLFNFPLTFGTCHKSRAGSNCLTESKKSSLAQTRVKAFQLGLFTECIAHSKAREKGYPVSQQSYDWHHHMQPLQNFHCNEHDRLARHQ